MNLITLKTIPHEDQRYDTCGDYKEVTYDNDQKVCHITISKLNNSEMEACVAVHELIEYILVKHNKINLKKIDEFDIEFENNRQKGNTDEPGDNPNAPYHDAHVFATQIEKMLVAKLEIDWKKYSQLIDSL